MPIHLKSIKGKGLDREFAVLFEPDLQGAVKNDQELYAAIKEYYNRTHKRIEIVPLGVDLALGTSKRITPQEFCETWRGD